ncbi:GGDEF domain-containing protein [Candidatus Magnetaquicoccus inordinatus]|uniref:GGDEF domain-containing protein n=1 Tax=Candidatus Magnetaquicoccus inordinatus TaxID=2496818 RepID=UPI00102D103E|nr:GGDEF domain-containing protein [Candidatus Magnetaquicoccus inordinatus]
MSSLPAETANTQSAGPELMALFAQVLPYSRLFVGIAVEEYLSLLHGCVVRESKAGEVLIAPGGINRNVMLILSGSLSIHLGHYPSEPVGLVKTGESVGELSIIGHSLTSAWVVSATDCKLLIIDEERVWALIDQVPAIARNLLLILAGWINSVNRRILEQREQIDMLQEVARIDALTGLFNRRWFDESLHRFMSGRQQRPVTLILLDIDHFKRFNDAYGHPGGDQALRVLADVLKASVRPDDVAARYGGEEFAIILPETSLSAAVVVAERIRHTIMHQPIRAADGQLLPSITLSFGVAESEHSLTPEQLTERADAKLYQAKNEGRNRVCS